MTEDAVVNTLEFLVRLLRPARLVELGAGPSTTPMFKATTHALGISFDSVDVAGPHATILSDAVEWMLQNPESVDFLFSDAGSWEVRVRCAELAPTVLKPGGVVTFHDVQPDTPLSPVLDEMGAIYVVPPGLGGGTYGGLAVWKKEPA